jgi:hypothetical protein
MSSAMGVVGGVGLEPTTYGLKGSQCHRVLFSVIQCLLAQVRTTLRRFRCRLALRRIGQCSGNGARMGPGNRSRQDPMWTTASR